MMTIIASYFLNDNWVASAAHSMNGLDAMVKLDLTQDGLSSVITNDK